MMGVNLKMANTNRLNYTLALVQGVYAEMALRELKCGGGLRLWKVKECSNHSP